MRIILRPFKAFFMYFYYQQKSIHINNKNKSIIELYTFTIHESMNVANCVLYSLKAHPSNFIAFPTWVTLSYNCK